MLFHNSAATYRPRWAALVVATITSSAANNELVVIDADTRVRQFKQELSWNEVAYGLRSGFVC